MQSFRVCFSCRCAEAPEWRALVFETEGLNRQDLVSRYMGMDVGVVTPKQDGMNLVAKEMLVCNPHAALMISSGAGTEQQLSAAGFYSEEERCYHRVADVFDLDAYAETFRAAALEPAAEVHAHGAKLSDFIKAHDIEKQAPGKRKRQLDFSA